jgi:hypothetical protein
MWRDEEVRILHHIEDKPWEKRIASDKIAGHLGRDGTTHEWWWEAYLEWEDETLEMGEDGRGAVEVARSAVAEKLDKAGDRRQIEQNRGRGEGRLGYKPLPQSPERPDDLDIVERYE